MPQRERKCLATESFVIYTTWAPCLTVLPNKWERPKASLALLGLAQSDLASCVYWLRLLTRPPASLPPRGTPGVTILALPPALEVTYSRLVTLCKMLTVWRAPERACCCVHTFARAFDISVHQLDFSGCEVSRGFRRTQLKKKKNSCVFFSCFYFLLACATGLCVSTRPSVA